MRIRAPALTWVTIPGTCGTNTLGEKSVLLVSKLDSQLEGCGFESHPILDGNGVKAMPGSIPAPSPGSFNWKGRKYRQPKGAPKKIINKKPTNPLERASFWMVTF